MSEVFFSGWQSLLRIVVVGVLAYVSLLTLLRLSGKRTLSKMNAFDLIVTVALGSTLATVLLSRDVALADGVLALALLIALQFAITWTSVRIRRVRKFVTGEPSMLLYRGTLLEQAMQRARVTEDEIRAAVREKGLASLAGAEAVVLETDGSLSVVHTGESGPPSSLEGLRPGDANFRRRAGLDARS